MKRIPTKWFNRVLSAVDSAQSQRELFAVAMGIKKQFHFVGMGYGVVQPNFFQNEMYYLTSDETDAWKQTYIENAYWKRDTRLIIARQTLMPIRWGEIDWPTNSILSELMDGILDGGALDGVTIPVHGPNQFFGFLHFTFSRDKRKNGNWLAYIYPFIVALAQHVTVANHALIKIEKQGTYPAVSRLSKAQRMCLAWAAEGKTTEDIAKIRHVSVSTVNKHLDAASILLNANNRTQAVAKAVDRSLIAFEYKKKAQVFYL